MTPVLLRLLAVLLVSMCTWAIDLGALQPQGYVSDFAAAIPGPARAQIEAYCGRIQAVTGAQFSIVTLDSLGVEPVEDVATQLYQRWGIGKKGKDEGLLLLLVIRDKRSRLEVGYGLEPVITDGTSGEILRAMRPALRASDYGEALLTAVHTLGEKVASAKNVKLDEAVRRRPSRYPESSDIPWPVLIGGAALLFWIMGMGRGRGGRGGRGSGGGFLPALILGNVMGRSYGGGGGGGFGGYDSGDSFGGFGGGSSGGGGASSDW